MNAVCLILALLGDGGFTYESTPKTEYEFHVEMGVLPTFRKPVKVRVYSQVSEERLQAGSKECPPCLLWYQQKGDPRLEQFEFEHVNRIPDWVTGQPTYHWQNSKGDWVSHPGWTGIDSFLQTWEKGEQGNVLVSKPKPVPMRRAVVPYALNGTFRPSSQVLSRHLEGRDGSEHRLNTQGMSYEEMLYQHNLWHTIHGPR